MFVSADDPILSTKLPKFEFTDDIDLDEVIERMSIEMMGRQGIGLSANQVGLPYRLFIMRGSEGPKEFINPRIISISEDEVYMKEGCLTYPHLFVNIKRPSECTIRFQSRDQSFHTVAMDGLTARCALHEMDHLDGINYLDRAKPHHLKNAQRKKKLRERKLKGAVHVNKLAR